MAAPSRVEGDSCVELAKKLLEKDRLSELELKNRLECSIVGKSQALNTPKCCHPVLET